MDRFDRLFSRWRDAEREAWRYSCAHRGCEEPHSRFIAQQLVSVARARYGRLHRELLSSRMKLPWL